MDWTVCVICQKITPEHMTCPKKRKNINAHLVYKDFLQNVEEFKNLDAMPVCLDYGSAGTPDNFLANNASWHRTCHQKFNNSKLAREKNKKRKQSDVSDVRRSKRQPTISDNDSCIFCEKIGPYKLHEFSTFSADTSLRLMANEMQDEIILSKLLGGDLIALEGKYHLSCLTQYRNRYRAHLRQGKTTPNTEVERVKARAFAELVSYVENSVESGICLFKLSNLHQLYQNRLEGLGQDFLVNKTRFKTRLLEHFGDMGLQEQSDGKNTILVFPEGMREMLKSSFHVRNYESEALQFAKVAKLCREELLTEEQFTFSGSFPTNCQEDMLPAIKLLISMILYGPTLEGNTDDSQACLTITQMLLHNCKKGSKIEASYSRHCTEREPPLPIYVGMNIHNVTRSKTLVEQLARLGLSISYSRVLQLENRLALSMCEQFKADGVVCPSNLRKGLFTVGALDNIDHDPSSTTAKGSFHGSGISIIQFPTLDNPGVRREPRPLPPDSESRTKPYLPDSFSIVPSLNLNTLATRVPEAERSAYDRTIEEAKRKEDAWAKHAMELLQKDELQKGDALSWAAYHASLQSPLVRPSAITALLPLFAEKADSPAMIKHAMDVLKTITEFLNPGQVPVLACDCPIFANCKYIQWNWPTTHGEGKLVIMFGGLHIEKALWNSLGDFLECSGWTNALTEAGVASSGKADSFLKAAHITRTRHAHQVTALVLTKLQHDAFADYHNGFGDVEDFQTWKQSMVKKSPTFQFWDIVLRTEIMILIFIRAHRENDFHLYVETLEELMFLFFALDHYNYSRWISVHIRDMQSLPANVIEDFTKFWVVNKTEHRFSFLPIDQVHEQENAKVKGSGGAVDLTENPDALRRWLICGPEQARLLNEFEIEYLLREDHTISYQHHEEGVSAQELFKCQTNKLEQAIKEYSNPFLDDCPELLVLHTRVCVDDSVVATVRNIEDLGKEQYIKFRKEVLDDRTKSIHDPVKKNSLPVIKSPKLKVKSQSKQIAALRSDVSLFGRLYIANQLREGDPDIFFRHENQLYPPSLSTFGKLRSGTKSDLLRCLETSSQPQPPGQFDSKVLDGAAIVHSLPTSSSSTFNNYAEDVFRPYMRQELQKVHRLDLIWDRYLPNSIKESTREKRGSGVRRKVSPQTKMPVNWKDFLRDSSNKEELFAFLSQSMDTDECPPSKELYINAGTAVISKGSKHPMVECTHEEADTRIVVHLAHAPRSGNKKILVRTVDTDVIVILIGQFFNFVTSHPEMDLWVAFGMGKAFSYYHINTISHNLGVRISRALPIFHAFSGSDTTSCFFNKGKKSCWEAWKSYPEVTNAFTDMTEHPFSPLDTSTHNFQLLERLTVLLYDKTSNKENVDEARRELFCKKNRSLENIPPTQNALLQHIKRVSYQGGIWTTSEQPDPRLPSPEGWGWTLKDNSWFPVWTTLPEAARACAELIKCGCKSEAGCTRCKCSKAGLPYTDLCSCRCQK